MLSALAVSFNFDALCAYLWSVLWNLLDVTMLSDWKAKMHQYYTLCVKLWRKTHRFFLRSVALLYRTISDKRMWKISLMFIFFLSLFKVVKLLLKEDSNMLTKELSFYIQDDDWLRSAFTFLSVDKSTLIIKSVKEICWDVIKSASFCVTCKSVFFLGWKTHFLKFPRYFFRFFRFFPPLFSPFW